jgi:hypothetical protein
MLQRSMGNLNNRLEECIRKQGRHLQDVQKFDNLDCCFLIGNLQWFNYCQ